MPGVPLAQMPGGPAFKQKFNAHFGEIQQYAPYAYDAMQVLAEAMQKAGSADPKQYLPALAGIDHQGVTGRIRFDAKGDLVGGAVTLYRIEKGEWQTLKTIGGGTN